MWRDAAPGARTGLVLGAAVILAAILYFSYSVLRPDYQTLFSDLDPQDAASLVAELERMKVPYRTDGSSIQVDKSQVHALRLKLMAKSGGAMRGGVGFEIFNNTDYGMTEFAQKINYQRALQGEIARTITALDEVKSARVHLVLPESGLFRKGGTKPKASITLAMKDGRSLAPEQVLGIQRLVAAAVPEIEPGAVTISDQRGVTLSRPVGGEGEDALAGRFGIKSEVETYFARKLASLFDKALGPGRAIVSVDVTINHDQVKVTREEVLPVGMHNGDVVGAITRSRTTQSSPASTSGAVAATPTVTVDNGKTSTSSSEIEYQNGRRVEQVVSMPGSIKRLSVAVVLPANLDHGKVEEMRQLVAMTVGLNPSRGDDIAITTLDAPRPAPAVMTDASEEMVAAPEPAPSKRHDNGNTTSNNNNVFAAIAASALLLLFALVAQARRRQAQRRLSEQGRERVLANVQSWLQQDPELEQRGGRS
jgi:flagellar M-ring protein FliF